MFHQSSVPASPLPPSHKPGGWTVAACVWLLVGVVGLQVAFGAVLGVILAALGPTGGIPRVWIDPIFLLCGTLIILGLLWSQRRRAGALAVWRSDDIPLRSGWAGVAAAVLGLQALNLARAWLSAEVPEINLQLITLVQESPVFPWGPMSAMGLAIVVLAPLTEEWLFRGVLQPALTRRWGLWAGLLIPSLLFGLMHGLLLWWPMALFGLMLGWLAHKYQSLTFPIIAHLCNNIFAFSMITLSALGVV